MPHTRRAFTLLELLLTIGIILVLASIVLFALVARGAANRAQTSNALRQIMIGYSSYYSDHDGALMPGFVSPTATAPPTTTVLQLGLNPRMSSGEFLYVSGGAGDPYDASSYVWRLAPYVSHDWTLFYADYRSKDLESILSNEFSLGIFGAGTASPAISPSQLGISLIPSFGLNSIYLGGDNFHGGYAAGSPWGASPATNIAATRFSDVRNPARVIAFAPTRHFGGGTGMISQSPLLDFEYGYAELRPPAVWNGSGWDIQWTNTGDEEITADPAFFAQTDAQGRTVGGGVPAARWGKGKTPVAHVDGSVETLDLSALGPDLNPMPANPDSVIEQAMKRWNPRAIGYP